MDGTTQYEVMDEATDTPTYRFDHQQYRQQLAAEQSLFGGVLGGIVGAVIGALIWAGLTIVTGYQIGYMAVAVGFLTGVGVRLLGKGLSRRFGIIGALSAFAGCYMGNALAGLIIISQEFDASLPVLILHLNISVLQIPFVTFTGSDVIFYGLALYAGYRLSLRNSHPTSEEDGSATFRRFSR